MINDKEWLKHTEDVMLQLAENIKSKKDWNTDDTIIFWAKALASVYASGYTEGHLQASKHAMDLFKKIEESDKNGSDN
jgi:hypothetical protein